MSDAITLDVLSSSPVQLDVGDADPIAREEIAALATRVTTVEGDVSGLSTRMGAVEGDVTALDGRMDAAEGDISTLGTTVDGIDARVEAIEADYVTSEDVMGALGGEAPTLVAGSSRAMLGDPETASWMERTTAADGAALIESVRGNTLRWNQLANWTSSGTVNGVAITSNGDGSVTFNGTSTNDAYQSIIIPVVSGHKYLIKGCPAGGAFDTYLIYMAGNFAYGSAYVDAGNGVINTATNSGTSYEVVMVRNGQTVNNLTFRPQLFDLTAMFGAGNEPATVAEFEAMFPEPYYPYDAGSLLPVRMDGVETVGFNQWDEVAEDGYISDSTGENVGNNTAYLRSKDYIPVFPGMAYHFTCTTGNNGGKVYYYDADKAFLSFDGVNCNGTDKTTPANARYMRFWLNYTGDYQNDICINISDPARNGTYEPYWRSERAIPASTYFPNGMRSAGTVRDELTATEAITRVGSVDLGTLTWTAIATGSTDQYRMASNGLSALIAKPASSAVLGDVKCAKYETLTSAQVYQLYTGISVASDGDLVAYDPSYATADSAAAFKTAMSGVMLHYALATPTTTPFDPPIPMSYRTGAGGTERVMVASGTTSAPPIFVTRYPLDPADLAASIAPVDGPIAKTNHQVGDLLMLGFTLCKATQVIVTGETIAIGTNVTKTTVAAELAALSE